MPMESPIAGDSNVDIDARDGPHAWTTFRLHITPKPVPIKPNITRLATTLRLNRASPSEIQGVAANMTTVATQNSNNARNDAEIEIWFNSLRVYAKLKPMDTAAERHATLPHKSAPPLPFHGASRVAMPAIPTNSPMIWTTDNFSTRNRMVEKRTAAIGTNDMYIVARPVGMLC